jgi:hypothetical protein
MAKSKIPPDDYRAMLEGKITAAEYVRRVQAEVTEALGRKAAPASAKQPPPAGRQKRASAS